MTGPDASSFTIALIAVGVGFIMSVEFGCPWLIVSVMGAAYLAFRNR